MKRDSFPAGALGRRKYPHEFKQTVVAESHEPGQSISKVARCYDLNANLVHKWRCQVEPSSTLVPVVVEGAPSTAPAPLGSNASLGTVNATLTLASGRTLEFKDMSAGALMTLLEVVS